MHTFKDERFFQALRSGLWDSDINTANFENLNQLDWQNLFSISSFQTVEGVVFDAIAKLPQEALPSKEILAKWMVRTQHIDDKNKQMSEAISRQYAFFESYGLRPILQKGQGVAQYYNRPRSRSCGDIDWCFKDKDAYDFAHNLMKRFGDNLKLDHGYSLSYTWEKFYVEHHQRLIELRNPLKRKYLNQLSHEAFSEPSYVDFGGTAVQIAPPTVNMVLVNAHILKHQVIYGIGFRQLCDIARMYYKLHGQFDPMELRYIYERAGMLKWAHVLHEILVEYLGLERTFLPFESKKTGLSNWMAEDILKGGNFGYYDTYSKKSMNKRKKISKYLSRIVHYASLAPGETISAPIIVMFSKISR